jgi:FKBP12-rapamycin complex-associated protein
VESLAKALDADFKPHLPAVLPQILTVFEQPVSDRQQQAELRVYQAILAFGSNIEEYLHLCLPVIINSMNHSEPAIRKAAVTTIGGLAKRVNLSEYASRIVHPLVRALPSGSNEFKTAVMDTMCTLVFQLGSDFAIFVPMVKKACECLDLIPLSLTFFRSACWTTVYSSRSTTS